MKSLYARFRMGHAHEHCKQKEAASGSSRMRFCAAAVALTVALGGPGTLLAQNNSDAGSPAQVAALYELQGAFHRASTVRDSVNGDSTDVIQQRIQAMLSLWTNAGVLLFNIGSPVDGFYIGNGDPANPSTCPMPSDSFANRGTLCTFFKYVAAPLQPANKFVSLAASYETAIQATGSDAMIYFQCHFFNVAPSSATGQPQWAAAGHLAFIGTASKHGNQWLFSSANVQPVGVPAP
jgi:hypothetical protein